MGKKIHTDVCAQCATTFTSTTKSQKYCSRSCSATSTQQGKPSKNRKLAPMDAPPPVCAACGTSVSSYNTSLCSICSKERRDAQKAIPKLRDRTRIRARAIDQYNSIRTDLVNRLGGCCVVCGATDAESRLDFDHIDPATKSLTVTAYILRNVGLAVDEALSKCQLLCRSCHCQKTAQSDATKRAAFDRIGERNPMAKLTDDQRLFILEQVSFGRSYRSLARELGVTHQSVMDVVRSPVWQDKYRQSIAEISLCGSTV